MTSPRSSEINRKGALVSLLLLSALGRPACLEAYDLKDNREVSARKPVNILSSKMIFDRLKGLILYKGNVKAVHDQVVLTADEIRALSENREATADGRVRVVDASSALTMTCGNLEYLDKMNLMTAHDHPLLTSLDEGGRPITVRGRQMELDSEKKTVVIHQNVQIAHEDGSAEAQQATFLAKEDKFILEENPKLVMSNGELTGRRIVSSLGVHRRILVEGMADAVFYPAGRPLSPTKEVQTTPGGPTSPLSKGVETGGPGAAMTPTPVRTAPWNGGS